MKILYGVVGEGMGHATRSRAVLEHLLASGHEIRVVVSGRAHRFLIDRFKDRPRISFDEIHGLHLNYKGNEVKILDSIRTNLEQVPKGLIKNLAVYRKVAEECFHPEAVISDFESWAYFYALVHGIPVVSIDNMQVINRCHHQSEFTAEAHADFLMAKFAVKIKLTGAYHYIITSFFFPPVKKERTTLVPPILRPEILAAEREPGDHILVYQTTAANQRLIPFLKKLPYSFRLYGMGRPADEGNVRLCAFSEKGFVEDLRTARALIAGGGYSLMSEAVYLKVPVLSIPLEGQFEQELNARYLEKLGYGRRASELDAEVVAAFIENTDQFAQALAFFPSTDNSMLYACVDEILKRVVAGEPPPVRLDAPAMGKFSGI